MKKEHFKKTLKYILIFSFLLGSNALAQDVATSTDDATSTVSYPAPKPNPYANLSPEEQAKLPISALVPSIKEQVFVDVTPTNPAPGNLVTLDVSAFGGLDVDSADINWILNGKSALKGRGEKEFSTKIGGDGKLTIIELHIQPQYGEEVVRTFKFNPSEVDVLWQANTYVPPFYKGKALYTPESNVEFVAMPNITNPNGSKIQPSKAVYDWRIDYTNYADKSGFNKSMYSFSGSILKKPTNVRVTAYDPLNQDSTGVGDIDIAPIQPQVVMYEVHPTYGTLFNTVAVGTYNFGAQDIELGAYPYFYSATSKQNISYDWKINGTAIGNIPEHQDFIVLQKLKEEAGESTIAVSSSLADKVLQQSTVELNLLY